jgi:hypothetical protein
VRAALPALVAAALFAPGVAHADRRACESAFAAAPLAVKQGHFVVARQSLVQCAADDCPAAMRPLCLDDLQKLTNRIPSVVFAARASDGHDLVDVRVFEGSVTLVEKLDGRALDLDPGVHTFRFETAGAPAVTSQVLVREGEQARPIVATFASPSPERPSTPPPHEPLPAPPEGARPIPWTVFAVGGLAVAASAAWAGFGIEGISERSSLSGCMGHCSASAVQTASTHLDIADGFMVASLVAWASTGVLFLTRPRVVPVVTATKDGAVAAVVGRF